MVDTLDSKSNVPWNVWVRVPPSVQIFMKNLDLHGISYEEARKLILIFIENNINNLPLEIITGNSIKMNEIVVKIVESKNLKADYKTHYNLGALIITEKY